MVKLNPLHCTKCGAQIFTKERDLVFLCENCGNVMVLHDDRLEDIRFRIVKFQQEYQGVKTYVPFYTIDADITIHSEENLGGGITTLFKGERYMTGRWLIYVCAADFPPDQAKKWNQTFTYSKPQFEEEGDFGGVPKLPVKFDPADAYQNAEFLFLAHELEKDGTLQSINYDFKVLGHELLYMPFYYYNNQYYAGLKGG